MEAVREPLPGHRVQIDVKFIAPLRGSRKKHYQFTAIDDSPGPVCCGSATGSTRRPRSQFVDYVLAKLPIEIEVIQTDNGAEFEAQFHYHVLNAEIGRVYIKPTTPRLNRKVERSHRIGPTSSPTGTRIGFISDQNDPRELFAMDADGGDVTLIPLPQGASPAVPAWQPRLEIDV